MNGPPTIKPPFLLRWTHVTNWMPFEVRQSASGFTIECRKIPVRAIGICSFIIAAVMGSLCWFVHMHEPDMMSFLILLTILTTIGVPVLIILNHIKEKRRGPVLIWDNDQASVSLPREDLKFAASEIDRLCHVTAKDSDGERYCQIQLLLNSGERLLLVSGYEHDLDKMLGQLVRIAPVPVGKFVQKSKEAALLRAEQPV